MFKALAPEEPTSHAHYSRSSPVKNFTQLGRFGVPVVILKASHNTQFEVGFDTLTYLYQPRLDNASKLWPVQEVVCVMEPGAIYSLHHDRSQRRH